MGHKRKDTLVAPSEWWTHLKHLKRPQNKAERQAARKQIDSIIQDEPDDFEQYNQNESNNYKNE